MSENVLINSFSLLACEQRPVAELARISRLKHALPAPIGFRSCSCAPSTWTLLASEQAK